MSISIMHLGDLEIATKWTYPDLDLGQDSIFHLDPMYANSGHFPRKQRG